MVYFVGAGTGAPDLITVRGRRYLEQADVIIYAGSLVNPELLSYAKKDCEIFNSATMTLEEVIAVMERAEQEQKMTVRLHTGEPSIYGAVREQMDILDEKGISYESCPGVSACFGAAASLNLEYTLPGISQSLIITRMAGKTPVPERESIESFAAHGASMAIYTEHRKTRGAHRAACRRRLSGGYACGSCIQGDLAGGGSISLYAGRTGRDCACTQYHKDCARPRRRGGRASKLRALKAV